MMAGLPAGRVVNDARDGRAERNSGSSRANGMVERGPAVRVAFLLVGALFDERSEI
jgi:hypothetical protein